jgi:hypothetical protein
MASRWTSTTGLESTKSVILEAADGWLLIRTTTGVQDCLLAVNAFDIEPGRIATRMQALLSFAFDSKGWLRLHDTTSKLVLDYEDFTKSKIGLLDNSVIELFPEFLEVEGLMKVDQQTLFLAADHTLPFKITGAPIRSAVHIIPQEDGKAMVIGADGIIGYAKPIDAELKESLSVDGQSLTSAISAIGDQIVLGFAGHRVEIASPNSPARIQFSTMHSPDPKSLVKMFQFNTPDTPTEVSSESMKRMQFLCSRAVSVYQDAEIQVFEKHGEVVYRILGGECSIEETSLAEGEIKEIVFRCDSLARALGNLSRREEYKLWSLTEDGKPFWYIDGDGRHFMMSSAPVMFKKQKAA